MRFLLPLLCLAVLLSACSLKPGSNGTQNIALVGPNHQAITLVVEVADSPDEHARGLMGRESLPEGEGMLFMFPKAEILTFWMKDTLIPLDIVYFDAQGKVVGSDAMTPCKADPCDTYSSEKPAAIALEVPAGYLAKNKVGMGWQIALPTGN